MNIIPVNPNTLQKMKRKIYFGGYDLNLTSKSQVIEIYLYSQPTNNPTSTHLIKYDNDPKGEVEN